MKIAAIIISVFALFLSGFGIFTGVWDARPVIEARVIWTYSPGLNDDRDAMHLPMDIKKFRTISSTAFTEALEETIMVNINGVMTTKDADLRFAWLTLENTGGNATILKIENIEYELDGREHQAEADIKNGRILPKGEMLAVYLGQFRPDINEVAYLRRALKEGSADLKYESSLPVWGWLKYILGLKPVELQISFGAGEVDIKKLDKLEERIY